MRCVLLAIVALCFAGLQSTGIDSCVTPVAGYDFEVRRPGGGHTKGQAASFSVQDGTNTAELKDGRLTVNGKQLGAIPDGAKILVDENGIVTVNGQTRSPQ